MVVPEGVSFQFHIGWLCCVAGTLLHSPREQPVGWSPPLTFLPWVRAHLRAATPLPPVTDETR